MDKTWLIVDVPFLCYRAFYTTGHLGDGGTPTGVLYGVLRDIALLYNQFRATTAILCFDYGYECRTEIEPGYKQSRPQRRKERTADEEKAFAGLVEQMNLLRTRLFRQCGFRNILFQPNREADDMIAAVCEVMPKDTKAVIISSDNDLQQLLSNRVVIFNPITKRTTNLTTFQNKWGISPSQWADVKAIAGCRSDDVPGIKGVGEKTAAKYLRSKLKTDSKVFVSIVQNNATWQRNLKLVTLPFPGTIIRPIRPDRVTGYRWSKAVRHYKMGSLRRYTPGM